MSARIHLAAIATIILLLVLAYVFSDRTPTIGPGDVPITIEVVNASYGLNCLRQRSPNKQDPIYKDDTLPKVRKNNALVEVSRLCNGKPSCQLKVDESTLGVNPAPNCYKDLEVDYRCFSYDRLRNTKATENNTISLTCPTDIE